MLYLKLILLFGSISLSLCLLNGLARTPPMGWLAWTRFTCEIDCKTYPQGCINHELFKQMADRLVADGFQELGYEYVNIDDCWSERERDPETHKLVPDRERFPNGIKGLADYIHSRGLKLGLYGDCGLKTCAGYPGQLSGNRSNIRGNYFEMDANTFAEWTIDSFKFDGCFIHARQAESICPEFTNHLVATRRPILLMCEWPFYLMYTHTQADWDLVSDRCNLWRYYDDIEDTWLSILNTIDQTVKYQSTIVKYHGPGHWFDPDQLVIGNFGLSWAQSRAQMALWSIWAAPLYMSNDLRQLDDRAAAILKNKHLININQDKLGVLGLMTQQVLRPNSDEPLYQAFVKPIEPIIDSCPTFAIVYLNRDTLGNRAQISFKLLDILNSAPIAVAAQHQEGLMDATHYQPSQLIDPVKCRERLANARFKCLDVFSNSECTTPSQEFDAGQDLKLTVEPNGVRAVLLEEISKSALNKIY